MRVRGQGYVARRVAEATGYGYEACSSRLGAPTKAGLIMTSRWLQSSGAAIRAGRPRSQKVSADFNVACRCSTLDTDSPAPYNQDASSETRRRSPDLRRFA